MIYPIIKPLHNPHKTQARALSGVHERSGASSNVKVSGSTYQASGTAAPVSNKVEIISYHFKVLSTFSIVTVENEVAKKDVRKDTTMPAPVIASGKYRAPS